MTQISKDKWTYEEVKKEAQKYKTIAEWVRSGKGSYSAASKAGWLAELTLHMTRAIKPNGYWTKERVIEDAKKYSARSEWRKKKLFCSNNGAKK